MVQSEMSAVAALPATDVALPALIAGAGERAAWRFLELLTHGLALLLAGSSCLSPLPGQETRAPAPESANSLRGKAEQGNALAQAKLGLMYENGDGVPQDYAEAVRWYHKAADQGNAYAQCSLGFMYENGQGVPQDYAEAVRWFRKAADQGNANAQCSLGLIYYYGQGVPQDYAEAVRWFRKEIG